MLSGARWVGEEVVETMEVMVPKTITLRQVTLQADLRSPGGVKPMRRSYTYVPTPDAAMVSEEYAAKVHEQNVLERSSVEAEFEEARMQQRQIGARHRDRKRRERNREEHGMARKPAVPALKPKLQLAMPVTEDAKDNPKQLRARAHAPSSALLEDAVERALSWAEC